MAPTRLLTKTLTVLFLLAALFAPSALAAESIGPAKPLGGEKLTAGTSSGTKTNGTGKEVLSISTVKPGNGQTVSGNLAWEVAVQSGSPTKVEFAVDGVVKFTDTAAPYGGGLDTTKLTNGNHTLTATASGSRGVKAATQVTVKVANAAPAPEPTPEPEPMPETGSGQPLYWGATIGSQLTGGQAPWDMTAVSKFEELTNKKVSMVQFFMPFANCSTNPCSYYAFPKTPLENVRQHGALPVLSWSSASIPSSINESNYQLSDVINGTYDSYIRSFATAAKAWGHPFFLRFNWEMNGNWFSWSEGANGNRAGEYVAAWRHVHDIFTEVGATNATWVWCPNVDPTNSFQNLTSLYPGNAYVDWTALDGYNWGTNPVKPGGWKTFDQTYKSTYSNIVSNIAPSKPMLIGEVASSEYGGSKAAWVKEMLYKVPREYPAIRGLLWFDHYSDNMDWPLETSGSAMTAFAEGIQDPHYVGNSLTELAASAIQPLA